ncbi:butyryl-CoA dehydrogenase [Desulfocucumis palustris]|uniref:Acyl-[acyl-carrier-protein] dehydrogenase MbtN n=1 Tax=Desulfocucumis palustris TaxID=1898651 RepID=A0A2L2XFP6_9FIRM|nr:acyl-CoA dehydrogenase family protein [Desulfocucumis palustris]GBF33056.1 butyryl-CoA dehydrogenase [Desulfocucumis palustris]
MALDLNTGDYKIFREAFKKFIDTEIKPHYQLWEEEGLVPRELWLKSGGQGFLCPWAEEKYGGSGADFGYSVIIAQELARAGTHVMFPLHSDIVVPYIASFGNPEQKNRWLPGCVSGELLAAVAMTEPDAGSDLAAIKTTAVRDGGCYVLNGAKTFISGGEQCDIVIVACKTDPKAAPPHRGISLLVVENGTPGFNKGRRLHKMGLKSQDTVELFFEDCRVPATNLLGLENQGFSCLMQKLQQERLVAAVAAQGLAEKMLKEALAYTSTRSIFGKPVSKFQHNAFKLVEMATEIEMGGVFLERLVEEHMEGKNVVKRVSMAKFRITETANRVAYDCLQLYGGYGYIEEYPICRDYRDIRVQTIYAGASEVMKSIIARDLGI